METPDSAMLRARAAFEASGLSLDEVGLRMGYGKEVARKSAWQFLNKTADPRMSMLRRFADAVGVPLGDLVTEPKGRKVMNSVRAQKPTIIENILLLVETMAGGEMLGDRRQRIGKMPVGRLQRLYEALKADPAARASTVIEKHFHEWADEVRLAEQED